MKKDWFNGNIKNEYFKAVKYSLIFGFLIIFICGVFFILLGLLDNSISDVTGRIVMCVLGGIFCLMSVIMFTVSIWAIRCYPKHKKIAHLFIQKDYFNSDDEK